MSGVKALRRIFLTVISFIIAVIYALPNVALLFAVGTVVIHKWISLIACFAFAYNFAKIVEPLYRRYLDEENNKQISTGEEKGEWVVERGFSYRIKDSKITFQFTDIEDDDGRQLNRLKFMRKQFFKDK